MKILTRDQFMDLPENVVYAMFAHGYMGPLCIKGASMPEMNQFLYSEISVAIVRHSTQEPLSSLAKAVNSGEPIELDFQTQQCERDVMPNQLFMTWEKDDVTRLVHRLMDCLLPVPSPSPPFPQNHEY